MSEKTSRLEAFEARLSQLKKNMEAGLGDRAAKIRAFAHALPHDPAAAREGLRHEAHKLRGVAGTFGHPLLGELSTTLEEAAKDAEVSHVVALTQQLLIAVQQAGIAVPDGLAPEPNASETPPTQATPPAPRRRVLVIDDDAETRTLLELVLRELGAFEVVVAVDGADGLAKVVRERFDLVLCDAMMPDMNGLGFCARVPTLDLAPAPPIVILSAADPHELGWNIDVPHAPTAWWRKPFRPKHLLTAIDKLLSR